MAETKLKNFRFEVDGKLYKIGVPEEYDEQQALEQGLLLHKEGRLKSLPKTEPITDRTPEKGPIPEYFRSRATGMPIPNTEPRNKREIDLAKKGVITDRGGKDFSHEEMTALNTAATKDELAMAVGTVIKKKFGASNFEPLDMVRMDEEDLLYFDIRTPANPGGTNKWVRFDQPVLTNPWEMSKALGGVAGYLGGAALGAITGQPGIAQTAGNIGAGTVTGLIEHQRQKRGVELGVNIADYNDAQWEAFKEGATVAGLGMLTDSAIGRILRPGKINSYYFDPKFADDYDRGLAEGAQTVAAVNEAARRYGVDPDFQPSYARQSGVKELLDLEATIEARQSNKQAAGLSERMRKMKAESDRTAASVVRAILNPEKVAAAPPRPPGEVGDDIRSLLDKSDFGPYKKAKKDVESQTGTMRRFQKEVDSERISPDEAVAAIRGSDLPTDPRKGLSEAKALDDQAEKEAWAAAEQRMGVTWVQTGGEVKGVPRYAAVDSIKVPMTGKMLEIQDLMLNYAKAKQTLFASGTEAQFGDFMDVIENYVAAGRAVPLSKLVNGIKQLRQIERQSFSNKSEFKFDEAFLKNMEANLVSIRDSYLARGQHGDVLKAIRVAEDTSKEVNDKWQRTALRDLVNDKRSAGQVVESIFTPGDASSAAVLSSALRNDPESLNVLRKLARARYVDSVYTEGGVVDPVKYKNFMRDHGKTISHLLDSEDMALLSKFGGLGTALQKSISRQKAAEAAFKNSFRGTFSSMNSEHLAERVFFSSNKRASNNQTALLIQFLNKNNPGLLQEFRQSVMQQMERKMTQGTGDLTNLTESNIRSILGQEAKLRMLFGSQYVMDLHSILKGIRLSNRSGKAINIPMQTPALSMFRVIFGPLDRTQRFISAAKQYDVAGYENALFKIITNPEKLRMAIKYGNLPVTSGKAGPILTILGIQFEDDEQSSRSVPVNTSR